MKLYTCSPCSDELCGDSGNEFFELSAVRTELAVAGTVLIGGQRRQVHKIMTFKMDWLRRNWVVPIQVRAGLLLLLLLLLLLPCGWWGDAGWVIWALRAGGVSWVGFLAVASGDWVRVGTE